MGQGLSSIKKIKRKKSLMRQRSTEADINNARLALQEHERTSIYRTFLRGLFNSDFSAPIEDVLTSNGKIMETACGLGTWIIDMALRYPNSEFIGLDLNPLPPTVLPKNIKFIKGNLKSIPYEDEEFDFLRTGELQTDFTEVEYKHAIDEMIRVTKRGGWIEINELDIYSSKHAPNYAKIVESFYELLTLRGINPQITEKLQYMLHSTNNLQDIRFDRKSINAGSGDQFAEICSIYFRDFYGQALADHLGLTYEDYLQTLWKNAEEEINALRVEVKYYRFWGQKK